MRWNRLVLAATIPALAIPKASLAQPQAGNVPEAASRWVPASGFGLAILAGGGATDFTSAVTRAEASIGESWTVRFALATRSLVGLEASYVGGANATTSHATLVRNGIEAVVRINAPLYVRGNLLEPYMFGGAGWNAYHLGTTSTATTSLTAGTDSTVSVPIGLGFMVGYRGFLADVRYTIRPTYEQSTFQDQGSNALTNWDAGAMVGYEF